MDDSDCVSGLTCQEILYDNENPTMVCSSASIASGHCENIGWEANSSGRREWCEDKCIAAGGEMITYNTDRGTTKESCSNYDDDDNVDSERCTYIITRYGTEECDRECQPFGGVWDEVM